MKSAEFLPYSSAASLPAPAVTVFPVVCFAGSCEQDSVLLLALKRREVGNVGKHEVPTFEGFER